MKRQLESNIQHEVKEGHVVITYENKKYIWVPPHYIVPKLNEFLTNNTFDYTVIHNRVGQAMFNVEDIRTNEDVLRQEINPIHRQNAVEWVVDE